MIRTAPEIIGASIQLINVKMFDKLICFLYLCTVIDK